MIIENPKNISFLTKANKYLESLRLCIDEEAIQLTELLALEIKKVWTENRYIYICGNGGSAANAIHMANDLQYGIGACGPPPELPGIRVEALSANAGVVTCLANDTGYENIYSKQLEVKGKKDDLFIALSGSGNSQNIVKAIQIANELRMNTFAILGFDGGECKKIASKSIHLKVSDMQIAEDCQLILLHMCMQWLTENKPNKF